MKILKLRTRFLIICIATMFTALLGGQYVYASVSSAGYCWNQNIGWVDMENVDYNSTTRGFTGVALFYDGKYTVNTFSEGEIDFTAQAGTSLGLTLDTVVDGNGDYPIIGQAFSSEIGWVFADHGGTDPAAVTLSGELTGNFWSNEIGWFNCGSADIGAGNTQKWDLSVLSTSEGNTSSESIRFICKDTKASNYDDSGFGRHQSNLCKYNISNETLPERLGGGEQCPVNMIMTQNIKSPAHNGQFNNYTEDIVREAAILQSHMNRLGFNSGAEDGIIGPLTDGAIKRMQVFLGTPADGYVGPLTRALINNSCGEDVPGVETQEPVAVEVIEPTDAQCHINYTRLIKLGTIGEDVKQVQTCMNSLDYSTGIVDGWYGQNTYNGITDYQRAQGLQYIDGIVGPETAGYLNGL